MPKRKPINNDIANWDKNSINPHNLVYDFKRILKPTGNIFIFTGYNKLGQWHEAFDKEFDTLWNKGHTWNFSTQKEMHNFFECPICSYPERLKSPYHPTQKPIKLLKHLISIASNPKDLIFDPFMGVGSTGIASLELNRRFAAK